MATGILAGGWLPVPTGPDASVDLRDAALPFPPDDASAVAPVSFEALLPGLLADPRPDPFAFEGCRGPVEDLAVLDRIHVIPRQRDLGAVISEQEVEVEVWNAYLQRAQILDDITVEGPSGVSVVDHLGLPAHFPGSASEIYVVEVAAEGDPLIDNLVTWIFVGIPSEGTNLLLVGFRLLPFPFEPNWVSPVKERYGYLTDIITAFDGTEQRRQLRAVPVGSIGYSILLRALRDAQMANAILFGNQANIYGVPRWAYRVPLAQEALAGTFEIYCTTQHIPFEVGGLVFLWRDPYTWEAHTIDAVNADHVVVPIGLRNSWPVGTAVVPMVMGRLSPEEAFTWESLQIGSQALVFTVEGFRP